MVSTQESANLLDSARFAQMDEKELRGIGKRAQKLVDKDRQLQQAAVILRDSRRLYILGRSAISRRLGELGHAPDDGVEFAIVHSMNEASMASFERQEVFDSLRRLMLPWVTFELAAEKEREKAAEKAEEGAREAERRQKAVPTGLPLWPDGAGDLPRGGEVVVLAGSREPVLRCLRAAADIAARGQSKPRVAAVHFLEQVYQPATINRTEKLVVPVGVNQWLHAATTPNGLDKFMQRWLKQTSNGRADLLLVDDLALAFRPLVSDYPEPRAAGSAQRNLRKWAEDNGCAVLAGLPLRDLATQDPPVLDADWEQLRAYARLLFVRETTDGAVVVSEAGGEEWEFLPQAA